MSRYNSIFAQYQAIDRGDKVCTLPVAALRELQIMRDNRSYLNSPENHAKNVTAWTNQVNHCKQQGFRF